MGAQGGGYWAVTLLPRGRRSLLFVTPNPDTYHTSPEQLP